MDIEEVEAVKQVKLKSTVYIDESGDLGYKTGTRWFVITAVIVEKEKENAIRQKMSVIKNRLNVQEIHLRKISDFYKRSYIVNELGGEDFTYINVIADTNKLDRAKMASSTVAYNYMCRMLLEMVSWFLYDSGMTADIVLSARGTSRDGELIQYIQDKLMLCENNRIASDVFKRIKAKTANSWDMLQLADVCATTTFLAYEINGWGYRVPCHFSVLKNHLYNHGEDVMRYGIKYFSDEMMPKSGEMAQNFPCKTKERTSGATAT